MSSTSPIEGKPKEQSWQIRTGTPHWTTAPLPAGKDAWVDYRDHDRLITPDAEHDHALPVRIAEPLGRGERAIIEEAEPGVFEARRAP